MNTVPPGTGPLSPEFTGIDPALMDRFISEMEHARGLIGEHTQAIRQVFATKGVPATSLDPIGEVERWIDERLPDLRRRSKMAHDTAKLPDWSPGAAGGLVAYEEKATMPAAEARRLGHELAADYKRINRETILDLGLNEKYQNIVATLADHADDAEFTAAFFAALGVRETLKLTERLRHGLTENEDSAIETVSRAFGTAISGGAAIVGFAAIGKSMKGRAESEDERQGMGDLLSAGRFPTAWLAQVVATQVFTPGDTSSGSTLAPYLNALAKDPGAARLAISLATRDSPLPRDVLAGLLPTQLTPSGQADNRPQLVDFLKDLNGRAAVNATSADAFGKLLASASGAYDEKDGEHSDAAARFAFTVITTVDDFNLADPTLIHLSEIAGSYATEITEGANLGDTNYLLPSAYGPVTSTTLPGLKSMFRLSPKDTNRFILTFADTDPHLKPFDTGMGDLARRLINDGVHATKSERSTQLSKVFQALGNVRGFELAAAQKLRIHADEMADADRKAFSWTVGNAMGAIGLIVPGGLAGAALWTALSTGWSTYDTYKTDPGKSADKLLETDNLETRGRRHAIAQSLMDAGFVPKISPRDYQATCPPGVVIEDGSGRLRPFSEIIKSGEDGAQSLDRWFIENGMGIDENLIGESTSLMSDLFNGRKDLAWKEALKYK